MGNYVPAGKAEQQQMLDYIGLAKISDLFADVPQEMVLDKVAIPSGVSELESEMQLREMADKNTVFTSIFRGAGAYNHYIPAIVKNVTAKEEFVTAYTPYQPEISQGILQAIFEYQTMICRLTGMDAANASVYDGASAAAEAIAMCKNKKNPRALISATANPNIIEVVKTYCEGADTELIIVPEKDGYTDCGELAALLEEGASCFYLQQPNYYGLIEDADFIGEKVHLSGAKYIMGVNPLAMTLLKTPGECGADIAVGEGQPLGMPLSFGGPYLGFMAAESSMLRKLPGRIVGETVDKDGKRAFVLTLQAREQHIRREKASSNICSNQALCALTASVYMTAMGEKGMTQAAAMSVSGAHQLAARISCLPGFELTYDGAFFHEFVTNCPINVYSLEEELAKKGILSGLPLSDSHMLWCVTEMNTEQQIDRLIKAIEEVLA